MNEYMYAYIQITTIMRKKGHEFEREQGGVWMV